MLPILCPFYTIGFPLFNVEQPAFNSLCTQHLSPYCHSHSWFMQPRCLCDSATNVVEWTLALPCQRSHSLQALYKRSQALDLRSGWHLWELQLVQYPVLDYTSLTHLVYSNRRMKCCRSIQERDFNDNCFLRPEHF